jgi:hypothetical protein
VPTHYPFPWRIAGLITLASLRTEQRSFRVDAMKAIEALHPPLKVSGQNHIPGPCVLTVNHFTRPGLPAWWLALGVSAALSAEVHWIVTSAWRFPDRLRSSTITPLSAWSLQRIAAVYSFTRMPPMPPRLEETLPRARAVREILRYATHSDCPVIGLAPEGGDFSLPGQVAELPAGLGRLMLHLADLGLVVFPVGVFETGDQFCLNFGQAYRLEPPPVDNQETRDAWVRQVVRDRMQALLPK